MTSEIRVVFVGSLDSINKDFEVVKQNFKSLIKNLAAKEVHFVVRSANLKDGSNCVPIDVLVIEALTEYNKNHQLAEDSLTLFIEPGISIKNFTNLKHVSHSATSFYRIEFYKELLELVDIVVGISGEFSLLRISMLCEWIRKPFALLPGAGGTADFLWQDYFKKFYQTQYFDDKQKLQIKHTPLICYSNPSYSKKIVEILLLIKTAVDNGKSKTIEMITPDNVTINELYKSVKKFSIGLWILIFSLLFGLLSITYYCGNKDYLKFYEPKEVVTKK